MSVAVRDAPAAPSLSHLLRVSSRTFALGIERLPARLSESVRVAYLLLRIADYLEDHETMPAERKASLLRLWERVLAGQALVETWTDRLGLRTAPPGEAMVAQHAGRVMQALDALPPAHRIVVIRHVRDATLGMARWALRGPRIRDEADLDDYMHEVAGRVGHLLTELFAEHSKLIRRAAERLMVLGREFGLGLQTVNVIRGLRSDHDRGWIFVPESFVRPLCLTREMLFDPANGVTALAVVDRLADKATRHLEGAIAYVQTIPRIHHSIRLFCAYPLLFAVRTLAISRGNPGVLSGEAKISRGEVQRIVRDANLYGWSNRWLIGYCQRLAER
ncbi:MAG: squalene/phytoene synthase family protein [Longimicrobiales bacterium]